jgi:hypothetical protein
VPYNSHNISSNKATQLALLLAHACSVPAAVKSTLHLHVLQYNPFTQQEAQHLNQNTQKPIPCQLF